mgnify:CR=1 FL=1
MYDAVGYSLAECFFRDQLHRNPRGPVDFFITIIFAEQGEGLVVQRQRRYAAVGLPVHQLVDIPAEAHHVDPRTGVLVGQDLSRAAVSALVGIQAKRLQDIPCQRADVQDFAQFSLEHAECEGLAYRRKGLEVSVRPVEHQPVVLETADLHRGGIVPFIRLALVQVGLVHSIPHGQNNEILGGVDLKRIGGTGFRLSVILFSMSRHVALGFSMPVIVPSSLVPKKMRPPP